MKLAELRIMRESGNPDMATAIVVPMIHKNRFQLCFGKSVKHIKHTLEAHRGNREFATIDAACAVASKPLNMGGLGYEYVAVFFPENTGRH